MPMKIRVQIPVEGTDFIFFEYIFRGIVGSHGGFIFSAPPQHPVPFSTMPIPTYTPTTAHNLPNTFIF